MKKNDVIPEACVLADRHVSNPSFFTTKIRIIFLQATMNKKERKQREKRFDSYFLAVYLANECRQRDQKTQQPEYRSGYGAIKQDALAAVFADKAAIVQQRLTPVGYLVTIARLFKIAFFRKKADGRKPILWSVFLVQ